MTVFEIEKVEDMTTILRINKNSKNIKEYQDFFKFFNFIKNNELNYGIISNFTNYAQHLLSYNKIIPQINYKIREVSLREEGVKITYEGTKIIEGRTDVLDGYEPVIELKLKEDEIHAEGGLETKGTCKLIILEEMLNKCYPETNDGVKKIKTKLEKYETSGKEGIKIASIDKIPLVIDGIKKLRDHIGMERLEEMIELRNAFNYRDINSEIAKELLLKEYIKRLELLLPKNL